MVSEEHPVPTAPEHPTCCVCKQPAARRCNECSSDTPLFLCEDKACFEQTHNACNGRRHEATLVAWDRRPTAAPTTCPTHSGVALETWCVACATPVCQLCLPSAHHGHEALSLADAWPSVRRTLEAMVPALEKDAELCRTRLAATDTLARGEGVLRETARALDEVEALFAEKLKTLRAALGEAAAAASAQAAERCEQLTRHSKSLAALLDSARAACVEAAAVEAQSGVLEQVERGRRQAALGKVPEAFVCTNIAPPCVDAMRRSVEGLDIRRTDACSLCGDARCPGETVRDPDVSLKHACIGQRTAWETGKEDGYKEAKLKRDGCELRFCDMLCNQSGFVRIAIESAGGQTLRFASKRLRGDSILVLATVSRHGDALKFASKELQDDEVIVEHAIKNSGCALRFASERFRSLLPIALAAVTQDGLAIRYVERHLHGDGIIVGAAVENNGLALQYVASHRQKCHWVVRDAVRQNPAAIQYADPSLREDKEFRQYLTSVKD